MRVRPLDVVLAAVRWGEADYPRFCIVLDVRPGQVVLTPCSTRFYDYRPGQDFRIDKEDPDFPATGLKDSSCVRDSNEAPWVKPEAIRKRYGCLQGDLADRFRNWYGAD